jgi:hypothetical protein
MTKDEILETIRALAAAHGKPPGVGVMRSEAGIKPCDWAGKYWARWSDALHDAGFPPNRWNNRYDEDVLLRRYAELMRKMGHAPTAAEFQLQRRKDPALPSEKAYRYHFGSKAAVLAKVRAYCKGRRTFRGVADLCSVEPAPPAPQAARPPADADGYVYLLRSGRHYKIGRTNSVERRTRELQLPHKAVRVHVIKTDDPGGVENYWNRRFANKRKNGEFFILTAADVRAFKRWRRI